MAASTQPTERHFCEHCGEYLPQEAKVCPKCGYPVGGYPANAVPQTGKMLSTARSASIMLLISSIDGFAGVVLFLLTLDEQVKYVMSMGYPFSENLVRAVFLGLIIFIAFACSMALLGAYLASKRKHFRLVVVCGFFSIFTLGVFFLEASFLGMLGLIATFRSKQEFT